MLAEQDDIVGEGGEQERLVDGAIAASVDGDALVAYFPAVAVGAMEDALGPDVRDSIKIGELVAHAVGEEEPGCSDSGAISESELEAVIVDVGASGGERPQLDACVWLELLAPDGAELDWWRAVLREEAMHAVRNGVRRRVCVEHEHLSAHAAKNQRRAKAGRPGADDGDIERLVVRGGGLAWGFGRAHCVALLLHTV